MRFEQQIARGADLPGSTNRQFGQPKPFMNQNPILVDQERPLKIGLRSEPCLGVHLG